MLKPGTRLGPYQIVGELGAGGMGEVYRARDVRLGREVALKVLPEEFEEDRERRGRFEREARAASALNHPNIVTIHDVGREGPVSYLTMELIEGSSLRVLLAGRMPVRKLLPIAAQIADGLAAAHAVGIVHRDLKPENIMIDRKGRVKILDFGLAKSAPPIPGGEAESTVSLPEPTREGAILGTLGYMSPEQASGKPADFRSDQFSFGSILYEMATGDRAFRGATPLETLSAIVRDEPAPLASKAPDLPAPLVWLIERCLEKQPERRYGSTSDMARDLENLRSLGSAPALPAASSPRPRFPALAAIAGAAVLAVIGVAIVVSRRPAAPPAPVVRFAVDPPPGAAFDAMPAVSPSGDRIAFVASGADGRKHLWIRRLDATSESLVTGADDVSFPFWSPDGRALAFFSDERLKRIPTDGGSVETVCEVPDPRGGTWGSRGDILFSVGSGSEIDRVPATGGLSRRVTSLDLKRGEGSERWPSFLPDGDHFLFYVLTARPETSGVYLGSVSSPGKRFLLPADSGAIYAAGSLMFRRGDALLDQAFDLGSASLSGEPRIVAEDVWWNPWVPGWVGFSRSLRADVLALERGGRFRSRLVWRDRAGKELGQLGSPDSYGELALSPDEKRLAVVAAPAAQSSPRESHNSSIWEFDLALGTATKIPTDSRSSFEDCPIYSPDGREMLYATYPNNQIFRQNAGQGLDRKPIYQASGFPEISQWSGPGNLVLFTLIDLATSRLSLWKLDPSNASASRVGDASSNEESGQISPDGRSLAYSSQESGPWEVYVRPFDGNGPRRLLSRGGGTQPFWSGDGTELFYIAGDARLMSVEIPGGDLSRAEPPRELFSAPLVTRIEARNEYVPTRDGRRFLVNVRLPQTPPMTVVVNGSRADRSP